MTQPLNIHVKPVADMETPVQQHTVGFQAMVTLEQVIELEQPVSPMYFAEQVQAGNFNFGVGHVLGAGARAVLGSGPDQIIGEVVHQNEVGLEYQPTNSYEWE